MGRRGQRKAFGDGAIERIKRISLDRPIVPQHHKGNRTQSVNQTPSPSELLRRMNRAELERRIHPTTETRPIEIKPIERQVQAAMYDHNTFTYYVVSFNTTTICNPRDFVNVPASRRVLYGHLNSWDLDDRGIPRAARDVRFEEDPNKGYVINIS
jgi:hypothetical protein